MSLSQKYHTTKKRVRGWIIGSPRTPTGKENFAFVYSTGRCGTLHLAKVFGDNHSYVCHEEEHKNTYLVMEEFLRPIANSSDQELAMTFVRDYKIPHMVRNLRMAEAVNYFDTGHQIIFGIVPALLEQLQGRIKFIRLRRDRLQTALSFVTAPEHNDPWMAHWKHREMFNGERARWAFRPTEMIVHLNPTPDMWEKLNRFQRYLWYVDEVERQWQAFLASFSFPFIEVQLEQLDRNEYERISSFLGIGHRKDLVGVRHHTTDEQPNRRKPPYTEEDLTRFADEYELLSRDGI